MKHFAVALALFQLAGLLSGQQPEAGFLKVVNLVSLRAPTYIRLGDFEFDNGRAIAAGEDSGMLALKPGSYTITVTNEGTDPKSGSVDFEIENARNVVVMCYDETMEKKGGEQFSRLQFNILTEAPPSDKPRLSVVSLLKQSSVTVTVGKESVTLADRKAHRIDPEIDETLPIKWRGKNIGDIEIIDPTHYIAFLYRNPESDDIAISLIQNEKLEYHPPLENDDETEEAED